MLRIWSIAMRISYMKNRKAFYAILIFAVMMILGLVSYKGLRFVMDKYHYLRDTVSRIDEKTGEKTIQYDLDNSWMDGSVLVAHAFGGKGSKVYTNALEAFLYNYDLGHRVFEVDFDLSDDDRAICSHDEEYWRYMTGKEDPDFEYSYENFMNTPLFSDYTPLDCRDVVDLLAEYPDIYIITDTKYSDELSVYKQFSQIVDYAKKKDPAVLKRIIPQIYTEQMLDYVMNVHRFDSVIFTLYQISWDSEEIAKYCIRSGVRSITVAADLLDQETIDIWKSVGIRIAAHTVNEPEEAADLLDMGVDMLYTDFLSPAVYQEGSSDE